MLPNKQTQDTGKKQLCIICSLNKDAIDQTCEIKVYSVSNPQQVLLLWAKSGHWKKGTRPANQCNNSLSQSVTTGTNR